MVATIFFSLAFLSPSVSMANLSSSVATIFSSYVFFFFVRLLSHLVAVSSLGFLSNSFSSPQLIFITPLQSFENGQALILVVFRFLFATYPQPFFPLFSVYEALFALSFSFLSERFSSVHAKAALAYSRNE